jgi:hypothetical protein
MSLEFGVYLSLCKPPDKCHAERVAQQVGPLALHHLVQRVVQLHVVAGKK